MKSVYAINTRTPTIKTHDEYDKYIVEETVEKIKTPTTKPGNYKKDGSEEQSEETQAGRPTRRRHRPSPC